MLVSLFSVFITKAGAGHLQGDGMVDETVDNGSRGHWVLKNPIPLTEQQIATDEHALALIALGQKGKEDLHFGAALLDITNIVNSSVVNF